MWEWREDTKPGGWRLDAASSWTWRAAPPGEWVDEPTPIFRAVASEWERRRREGVADHRSADLVDENGYVAPLPEPRPASGPVAVQRSQARALRHPLAVVDGPTPPLPRGGCEDEPRRPAEDRRPPLAAAPATGARHALQPREETPGRHTLGFVTLTPRT
jgi:hypothetical protein